MSDHNPRLLLVDDDPMNIRIMSEMLSAYSDKRFATTGESAILLAMELKPDLILLDADMPDMTGFDVCETLKKDPQFARVPIIFVTSHDSPALEVDALKLGAADYITKPLAAAQLRARVGAQLRVRRLVLEIERDCRAGASRSWCSSPETPDLLIVGDDLTSAQMLRRALSEVGTMHFAGTASEASRAAREHPPTVILIDEPSSGKNGLTICAALKADPALKYVPIVFIDEAPGPSVEEQALALGAVDVVAKPFKAGVLKARIDSIIGSVRRLDADIAAIICA